MTKGKILLVGFGPGSQEQMSYRAREAIAEADVVIGYSTYIKLVSDLLDGKEVIKKGMTEEIDRCLEAWEHASRGRTVALVSSGDIGVYGMAGPTFEVLFNKGWTPDSDIKVEVIPGSTALSACASLVGAPLTHDFCSISLSDLLTPWPVIARRVEAAAVSDFVIALYNPKSGRRTGQIVEARKILLRHRSADTPVAIVKSAYRDLQDIQMVTLETMAECKIGMLTTVLIGNSSTFMKHNMMITPRGYANKYDPQTGGVKDGEKRGRSLSMGLEGWKAAVRAHLRVRPDASLRDTAAHFEVPVGEIVAAITEADGEDRAGDYLAVPVRGELVADALTAAGHWGPLLATVCNDAGATSKLQVNASDLHRDGDKLHIKNDHVHLHVDCDRLHSAAMVLHAEHQRAVMFLDVHGREIFSLSLLKHDGVFQPRAEQAWMSYWRGWRQ